MANEATVQCGLVINGPGKQSFRSPITSFRATMSLAKGATPGAQTITEVGTDISLAHLDNPGLAWFRNLEDPTDSGAYAITVGRWDPDTDRFYPFIKLLPGEAFPLRLADQVTEEFSGTGTGTTATISTLRAKVVGRQVGQVAENAEAILEVFAFND